MQVPCIKCKGSDPMKNCGRTYCPIYAKASSMFKVKEKIGKDNFQSSSNTPFVGRYGYPNINVGTLSPPEKVDDDWLYDAPSHWAANDFQIQQIIGYRGALINSRFKTNVKKSSKFLEINQELAMASKPAEVEINLKDKPKFRVKLDAFNLPMGPNAQLERLRLGENPKIPSKVDKVVSDYDLKAGEGLKILYEKGFDENALSKLLSVGNLGLKKGRKLVPTRWSITATDSNLGNDVVKEVKQFNEGDYLAFFGSYIGNYYLILCFPEPWSYELFETYMPNAEFNVSDKIEFMTDYEPYRGRKKYAENCAGGFYSVRLAILEKLKKMKRQCSVLALRFITGEYFAPLGVWVTRFAARKALEGKGIEFGSKELMLDYARLLVKRKFGYDADNLLRESVMLKEMREQSKLSRFF
ncbi:MAG: hypothetical protein QF362_03795 [Candidatus Woesearchaeota archaeon]|nr:hypothetical protein [Candidatus Woesearchaeota archaeon]